MDTLIAIGTSSAYLYSLAATFIPALQAQPVFYETSAFLLTFVILGKLSRRARRAARATPSRSSWTRRQDRARCPRRHGDRRPVEQVVAGDVVVVRPGEKVPVDGLLIEGRSSVDSPCSPASPSRWRRTSATP